MELSVARDVRGDVLTPDGVLEDHMTAVGLQDPHQSLEHANPLTPLQNPQQDHRSGSGSWSSMENLPEPLSHSCCC